MLAFAPMPTGANHNKDLEYEDVEITIPSAATTMTCTVVFRRTRGTLA
jgi:hypothetical protein